MNELTDISQSEKIVQEYGNLLASLEPSLYGTKESLLPYPKEEIKVAIQTIILNIRNDQPEIYDSLTQAYIFLAQFIEDEKADIADQGRKILESEEETRNEADLEIANQAVQTINMIKSEMENPSAKSTTLLTNIVLSTPAADLFEVPADFTETDNFMELMME